MKQNFKQDRFVLKLVNSIEQPLFKNHALDFGMTFVRNMNATKTCYPDRSVQEVRDQIKRLYIEFIDEWEEME